jgi:hypothetical protein
MLKSIAGTDTLRGINLAAAARSYLLKNGMTASEIDALQKILAGK